MEIIPVEVVARHRVAGSLAKRVSLEKGRYLPHPILEFYYKRDDLGNPMINEDHIAVFEFASQKEIEQIKTDSLAINSFLKN